MISFVTINAAWSSSAIAEGDGAAVSVGFGLIYTLAGLISIPVGRVATSFAHDGAFIETTLVLGCAAILLHLVQIALLAN